MEHELRHNLLRCATAYSQARNVGLATLGRLAAGDWRFFDRLEDDSRTFTARKYDEIILWFSENWPADLAWPADLDRPATSEAGEAA